MKKVKGRKAHHARSGKRNAPSRSPLPEKSRRGVQAEQLQASDVTYEVVQHDGGWAYKVNGAFSEAFPSHAEALAAAQSAAVEQELPGDAETIEYEDDRGEWHSESVSGRDRPHAVVKDTNT
jgi:Uncharacterized protein conserved in bacteria (DUF2188)